MRADQKLPAYFEVERATQGLKEAVIVPKSVIELHGANAITIMQTSPSKRLED